MQAEAVCSICSLDQQLDVVPYVSAQDQVIIIILDVSVQDQVVAQIKSNHALSENHTVSNLLVQLLEEDLGFFFCQRPHLFCNSDLQTKVVVSDHCDHFSNFE